MRKYILVGPIIVLLIWFMLSFFKIVNPLILPSPIRVFKTIWILFTTGTVYLDLVGTIFRWLLGLLVGIILGIPTGIFMGYSEKIYSSLELIIDFFRSLPSIVLYPLFILFFGIGDLPKVIIVIFATFLYVTINTIYGVKYGKESRLLIAKSLKMRRMQTFKKIILPGALPEISAGIRISLTIGLIVIVGSEMILGAYSGLGKRMLDATMTYDVSQMYALIILIGLLGYLSNKAFVFLENKIIHWKGK